MRTRRKNIILRGVAASPGISIGETMLVGKRDVWYIGRDLANEEVEVEVARFRDAVERSKDEIRSLRIDFESKIGTPGISFLEAQILLLEDKVIDETMNLIRTEKKNAEFCFQNVAQRLIEMMSELSVPYLRERVVDVKDVKQRVIENLAGKLPRQLDQIDREAVLIVHDISPSDATLLRKEKVLAFASDLGGKTSHASIMLREIGIPAVVGLKHVTEYAEDGDTVIIDGAKGIVVIDPSESTLRTYVEEQRKYEEFAEELERLKELDTATIDGHKIDLSANIEFEEEIPSVHSQRARGVGLFRTEYLFMKTRDPSEEEQYQFYDSIIEKIYPESVIVRTVDIGGDKVFPGEGLIEANPFLGWRAIRFCLEKKDFFKTHLRAILRASTRNNVKIMFPMISSVEEIKQCRAVLEEAKEDLRERQIPFDEKIEVGIMVEIPSVAMMADLLAPQVDFFSIGSNDLTQYTLAVDRGNEYVADLFDHLHPSVLRLVKKVVDEAHKHHIWVGVCGEMAGDPVAVPVLLGFGVDELSTNPVDILKVKDIIRSLTMEEAKDIAARALALSTTKEVRSLLTAEITQRIPKIGVTLLQNGGADGQK
jgi:phosphotransferase system enzyme I (PtsI)